MKPIDAAYGVMLAAATLLNVSSRAQETERLYLSGHDKDDAVPWKFMCTSGAQSGYWTNLVVPSNWELHGFGSLNYHKDPTSAYDEKGLYEHDFTVPSAWSGKRVFLVFEGVMTDTSAKLNGQSVGPMHQGSFYRFKYEVTPFVKIGATNRLEVTVAKHSANESVNRAERLADYWVFGGIYRPVYLEAVPREFIERVAIDARAIGNFSADVFLNGATNSDEVEAQIKTLDGKNVGQASSLSLKKMETGKMPVLLSTHIASPLQWTAETPNLYAVEVRLKRGSEILHRYRQRFGFRTFEVREGDGLYLNGRRIVLKGADRHSCWPDSGRCLSEAVYRLDIETMKDMNMNAVRMSHYPPDAEFLDLCDELGLYVLDELAGWHNFYDTETGTRLVREMVERDVNHASILFWDNGNEGGFNTNLDHLFGEFDPQQRHVLHPWAIHGGVNTAHYNLYEQVRAFCASNTIYMPTEFQHGLFDGGAGAGLEDYWSVMGNSRICAGGFIWALIDEGVKRPDTGQIDVAGNQAPDGIVGPYRQREGSFYTIKELWSPIQVKRESEGTFTLENHYSFTDARQCKFTWQLRGFGWPDMGQAGFKKLAEGSVDAPKIPPGDTGKLTLNLPKNWENADALALRAEDPGGRELWTWVWPLNHLDSYRQLPDRSQGGAAHIGQTSDAIEVTSGDLKISFSKESGMLAGVQRGARKFSLTDGPRPAAGSAQLVKIDSTVDGSDAVVTATFSGDMKRATWRIRPNSWIQCDYTYTADGPKEFFGVGFDYPESLVKSKRWLGEGPFRVWKNRLCGGTINVWSNSYNNTITGWRDWIYPEFKGCFAGVRWMQLQTIEGPITFLPGSANTFVQVLTPEFPPPNTVGKTLVHLPHVGLAFLDAIPPVGSKFKDASTTGPQGQLAVGKGEYSGSVSFYFGKLPQAK